MTPTISVIILNYNGHIDTCELLDCFLEVIEENFNIILVDNCSTDISVSEIEKWLVAIKDRILYNRITFIKNPENGGFSKGNNIGIRYAIENLNSDIFWILNNDTIIDKNAIRDVNEFFKSIGNNYKNIGIWGNTILYFHNRGKIQYAGGGYNKLFKTFPVARGNKENYSDKYDHDITPDYDFVYGASMFVTKEFIENVGLLSEEYFIYFEELDWAYRAKSKGMKLGFIPKLKVYHKEGATISKNSNENNPKPSQLSTFYFFRNKITFTKKHQPHLLLIVYIQIVKQIFQRLLKKDFKEIKMILYIVFNPKKDYYEYSKR